MVKYVEISTKGNIDSFLSLPLLFSVFHKLQSCPKNFTIRRSVLNKLL